VYAPVAAAEREAAYTVRVARRPDDEYIDRTPVPARRIVYRMRLQVHGALADPPPGTPRAGAELAIDTTGDRLRARFLGDTWTLQPGAEVRVRRGAPGTYVFDATGGRPIGPGELSAWFVGESGGRDPFVRVRGPRSPNIGPAPMVCRLLAEWGNTTYSSISSRCRDGAPPWFRIGLWFGTLSADVTMDLPASSLRADERDPPHREAPVEGRTILSEMMRVRLWPATTSTFDPGPTPRELGALTVRNATERRMLVIVDAVAVAWVEAGATWVVHGIPVGLHHVGGQRPFGHRAITPVDVIVPGEYVMDR
jgi:hypothetical protein